MLKSELAIRESPQVYAYDTLCGTLNYNEGQHVYQLSCTSDETEFIFGSRIRIIAPEGKFLSLCEVKVCRKHVGIIAVNCESDRSK